MDDPRVVLPVRDVDPSRPTSTEWPTPSETYIDQPGVRSAAGDRTGAPTPACLVGQGAEDRNAGRRRPAHDIGETEGNTQ